MLLVTQEKMLKKGELEVAMKAVDIEYRTRDKIEDHCRKITTSWPRSIQKRQSNEDVHHTRKKRNTAGGERHCVGEAGGKSSETDRGGRQVGQKWGSCEDADEGDSQRIKKPEKDTGGKHARTDMPQPGFKVQTCDDTLEYDQNILEHNISNAHLQEGSGAPRGADAQGMAEEEAAGAGTAVLRFAGEVQQPGVPAEFLLDPAKRPEVVVGRGELPKGSLELDSPAQQNMISRKQAKLEYEDGHWRLRDSKSTNGVLLNGVRVSDAVLKDGDTITFGGARTIAVGDSIARAGNAIVKSIYVYKFITSSTPDAETRAPGAGSSAGGGVFRDRHLGEVLCAAFATRKAMTEVLSFLKDKDKLAFRAVKASITTEGQQQQLSKEQIAQAIAECRPGEVRDAGGLLSWLIKVCCLQQPFEGLACVFIYLL